MASLIAGALSAPGRHSTLPALTAPASWEVVLGFLDRAAETARGQWAAPGPDDVQVAPGDAPDEVVLYMTARDLPAADKLRLRQQAQELARTLAPEQADKESRVADEAAGVSRPA
jgi:hypothetical protein